MIIYSYCTKVFKFRMEEVMKWHHKGIVICSIFAFVLLCFLIVKAMNKMRKKEEPAPVTTKVCPHCMSEIHIDADRCPHCTSKLDEN